MLPEEIKQRLIELLDLHLNNPDMPIEDNYKNAFFRLFREVYDSGLYRQGFTDESLRETLSVRWKTEGNKQKEQLMNTVLTMWDAWYYALETYPVNRQ